VHGVWWMDVVFDRVASGRTTTSLMLVDDATHEPVATVPEYTNGGDPGARLLDGVCSERGAPLIIGTENGTVVTGTAVPNRAHRNAVTLRLVEPGKPSQHACVAWFDGRLHDDCCHEHWFVGQQGRQNAGSR